MAILTQGSEKRLRWGLRLFAIVLGASHSWVAISKQAMNEDGIAYLDMGGAILAGNLDALVNGTWSPLYPALLGTVLSIVRPPLEWEFAAVHVVNLVIYVVALLSFEFFWRQLERPVYGTSEPSRLDDRHPLPRWSWTTLGYLLFVWTALYLIEIWAVTPDMLLAAFVYLAAGLLVKIGTGSFSRSTLFVFGIVLGLGYLTKAAMFPLAFVFMAVAFVLLRPYGKPFPRLVLVLSCFLLVAGPLALSLSIAKDRPTIGDVGRMTYLRHVNHVPYPHWRTETAPDDVGTPRHPARRLFEKPAVFEFAQPIGGTYPLSYDPSYWYDGLSPAIDLKQQMRVVIASFRFYAELFLYRQGPLLGVVALLLLVTGRQHFSKPRIRIGWLLIGACLAAFVMYALVYVEGRYIAPFVLVLWGGALGLIRMEPSAWPRRSGQIAGGTLVAFAALAIVAFNLSGLGQITGWNSDPWTPSPTPAAAEAPALSPVALAGAIRDVGLEPGDSIAYIGHAFEAFFARLARLKIIAEIPEEDAADYWQASPETQTSVLRALERAGAQAVVAWEIPGAVPVGWEQLGSSRHYVYRMDE